MPEAEAFWDWITTQVVPSIQDYGTYPMAILQPVAENKVHSFSNELFGNLTVLMINNEPWFIAKEVTDKLEYPDAYDAVRDLCPDRRKVTHNY
ncbi:BRO-N domain-containing protein [Desulfonatronum parangueonense]